jgi:PAS domain S-box-containing protein
MNALRVETLELAKQLAAQNPHGLVEMYTVHDQRCVWASPSHRAILGYNPQELVGKHWKDIVDPADHAHKDIMINDALLTGGSMEISFYVLAKSGQRRHVRVIDTLYSEPDTEEQYVICRTTQIFDENSD